MSALCWGPSLTNFCRHLAKHTTAMFQETRGWGRLGGRPQVSNKLGAMSTDPEKAQCNTLKANHGALWRFRRGTHDTLKNNAWASSAQPPLFLFRVLTLGHIRRHPHLPRPVDVINGDSPGICPKFARPNVRTKVRPHGSELDDAVGVRLT